MDPTPRTLSPIASAPEVGGHRDREQTLHEARSFRLGQVAALELELADDPRRDTVMRALLMAALTALAEIDAALDRMAQGLYGRCVTCARPIPEDRLEALPMAAQCMPCRANEHNCRFGESV
jgi:DnaK suppressor protein